jgi:RNA polymerase sigma-70 factor (sigma-E family)
VDAEPGFVEFAGARSPALFRTAWLLTGDWHLAEDLVQDTLGRVYVKWSTVSRAHEPAAYAHTVLVHQFLSRRRRRSSGERPVAAAEVPDVTGRPDDPDLRVVLRDALARLDRTDRAVLVLRYWEDLDASTTGALVHLSPAAVRTRARRALGRLREVLGDDLADLLPR